MIIHDKRKVAMVILAKMMPSGKELSAKMPNEEYLEDGDEGFRAVAEEIIMAIESKSVEDLASSLKSFFLLCESSEDEGE